MARREYTEAKARANKKWDANNKERARYINARSAARSFIRNKATQGDIDELRNLIAEREKQLKGSKGQ